MKYKNRLAELRGDMSQEKFANMIGLKQQNYWKYENGVQGLRSDLIERICTTFGCSAEWLLCLDYKPISTSRADTVGMPNRLEELMKEKNLTCTQISSESGLSYTFVNELKNHTLPMKSAGVEKIIKLAKYLDVSVEYLLGDSDQRGPYPFAGNDSCREEEQPPNVESGNAIQEIYENLNEIGQLELQTYGEFLMSQERFLREESS